MGGTNGEIEAKELTGELQFIERVKNPNKELAKAGIDLKAASGGVIASFECGGANGSTGKGAGTGTLRELEGSVIGRVGTTENMVATNTTSYEVSAGAQAPEQFEGGLPDTLVTLVGLTKAVEPTTLVASEEVKSEEPIEIRAKICSTKKVCAPNAP